MFGIFIKAPKASGSTVLTESSVGAYGPKIQQAAAAIVGVSQKIALGDKDLGFLKSELYNSFTELPVTVEPTKIRGRENPFIPYATP